MDKTVIENIVYLGFDIVNPISIEVAGQDKKSKDYWSWCPTL